MANRLIHHHAVVARREGPAGIVAPEDFQLILRATSETPVLPPGALAYCADFQRERLLFTCHDIADLPKIFARPFLFMEQLSRAGSVLSVPCERLDELGLGAPVGPVFVFSPGRAGSTLLARLLTACGVPCASEPDMLTQLVCLSDEDRLARPPGMDIAMARICMGSIGRALGPGLCLKLRSQCDANPLLLLAASGNGRVVFLLRNAETRAVSRTRAFGEGPAHIAGKLRETIDAINAIDGAGIPVEVIWYERMVRHPAAALRAIAPDCRPAAALIASVMRQDSQGDTMLARTRIGTDVVPEGFLPVFRAAWAEICRTARWGGRAAALARAVWQK